MMANNGVRTSIMLSPRDSVKRGIEQLWNEGGG